MKIKRAKRAKRVKPLNKRMKKIVWSLPPTNAGVGWDYPKYRSQPTDPIKYLDDRE